MELERLLNEGHITTANLKNYQHKIPKVRLQMFPFHTEILEKLLDFPVMLALLSALQGDEIRAHIGEDDYLLNATEIDRIVVKVFDPMSSIEGSATVYLREFALFATDLEAKYSVQAASVFMPGSIQWWMSNAKKVTAVRMYKKKNMLSVCVSKFLIEQMVSDNYNQIPNENSISTEDVPNG